MGHLSEDHPSSPGWSESDSCPRELFDAAGAEGVEAAREARVSPTYARKVIRAFQKSGWAALGARHGGGRARKIGPDQVQALTALTHAVSLALALPWTEWFLTKLREYACTAGILPPVGAETLRCALHRAGIRYQRTKTWKGSNDPLVHEKYCRIKALYEHCPAGAAVICVDEFGPLELRPYQGQGWHRKKHPQRLPATYHRLNGVRHFLAYYDVHADDLDGWFYRRKRRPEAVVVPLGSLELIPSAATEDKPAR